MSSVKDVTNALILKPHPDRTPSMIATAMVGLAIVAGVPVVLHDAQVVVTDRNSVEEVTRWIENAAD